MSGKLQCKGRSQGLSSQGGCSSSPKPDPRNAVKAGTHVMQTVRIAAGHLQEAAALLYGVSEEVCALLCR